MALSMFVTHVAPEPDAHCVEAVVEMYS